MKSILKTDNLNFKDNIFQSKKYWTIYIILLLVGSLSMLSLNNIEHPKMEILMLICLSIIGILLISYYFSNKSQEDLYKVAFVIIVIFGLLCVFTMPICEPSDCPEHLTRAEITSRGILFPEYTGNNYTNYYFNGTDYVWDGSGFETIQSIADIKQNRYNTVFTMENDDEKINNTLVIVDQCAEQNPFYGYLPQALGIIIAKLLDLNVIWLLWMARIMNLLFYAGVISLAVKKSPIFKIPIIFTACLPMAMFQGVSVSIDSMIIALTILLISYFFYMYKSEENSLNSKNILLFISFSFILGLLKLPSLAFSLLIFAVPKKNFNDKNKAILCSIGGIIIIGLLGLFWSRYATDALWHSYRATHYISENVNATLQMDFFLSSPYNPLLFISKTLESIYIMGSPFLMYPPKVTGGYTSASDFITMVLLMAMGCVYLAYPINEKIVVKSKIISLLSVGIFYIGTCFVQFLTWSPQGELVVSGISPRYFMPLLVLIPFIFGINIIKEKNIEFDYYIITLTVSIMALMVMSFIFGFY